MRSPVLACALPACALPALAAVLVLGTVLAPPALAQEAPAAYAEPPRETPEGSDASHWQPHWERFDAAGAVIIAVAESAAWAVYLAEPVTEPLWTSTLPLDEEMRSVFRITDQDLRRTTIDVSDVLFVAMTVWPIAVDSLLLAGAVRGDWDVALQMTLIDLEVLAVAHMATWLTSRLTGRVRPESIECAAAGTCADDGSGPVASFVGGHNLMAYTSAGLTCTHLIENPWITGNVETAAVTCGTSLALATAIGFMRLGVDRHWASDIVIGSAMGAALGFGLPQLLHYGRPRTAQPSRAGRDGSFFLVTPGVQGDPRGATVTGTF